MLRERERREREREREGSVVCHRDRVLWRESGPWRQEVEGVGGMDW
jgi:hypothetical protein